MFGRVDMLNYFINFFRAFCYSEISQCEQLINKVKFLKCGKCSTEPHLVRHLSSLYLNIRCKQIFHSVSLQESSNAAIVLQKELKEFGFRF